MSSLRAKAAGILAVVLACAYLTQVASDTRLVAPAPTAILLDRDGAYLTQAGHWDGARVEYGWWNTPAPERVFQATLALEDHRFWSHPGIDPLATARALWQHLSGHGRSGASTLAMQVARMQHPRPRTLWAKALEAGTALTLTARYGRPAILAQYLRLAPYGEGSHGIGHAARWFFDTPAQDLGWAQAALLAAVPQALARLALRHPGTQAITRAARALDTLATDGTITPAERDQARAALATPGLIPVPRRPDPLLALRLQHLPGELVRTTIDLGVQRWATHMAATHLHTLRRDGAQQVAIMIVRRGTRAVLASVGAVPSGPGAAIDFTTTPALPR